MAADAVFVYITCADESEALAIGRSLVETELAACANLVPGMRAIYRWQGEICEDVETVLIAKTTAAAFPALSAHVCDMHSYDCPCVVALPITAGSEPYLSWLAAAVHAP
jgi:periplasmic divalent cation tolerance protein